MYVPTSGSTRLGMVLCSCVRTSWRTLRADCPLESGYINECGFAVRQTWIGGRVWAWVWRDWKLSLVTECYEAEHPSSNPDRHANPKPNVTPDSWPPRHDRNLDLTSRQLYNSKTYCLLIMCHINRNASSPSNPAPYPILLWLALKGCVSHLAQLPSFVLLRCIIYTLYTHLVSRPVQHVPGFSKGFWFSDTTHPLRERCAVCQYL